MRLAKRQKCLENYREDFRECSYAYSTREFVESKELLKIKDAVRREYNRRFKRPNSLPPKTYRWFYNGGRAYMQVWQSAHSLEEALFMIQIKLEFFVERSLLQKEDLFSFGINFIGAYADIYIELHDPEVFKTISKSEPTVLDFYKGSGISMSLDG
jgi:hypothetical protein